jgi:foldase protein PrsA
MVAEKTSGIYTSETMPPGRIPDFTDEEMSRVVAEYDDTQWRVRQYVDRIKAQMEVMRPGYGTDAETIKSILTDFITGQLWMLDLTEQGYDQKPEVLEAADRAAEEAMVTALHDRLVEGVVVTEDSLEAFYEANREEMVTEPSVSLAAIMVDSEEAAEEIFRKLEGGADFAALARELSVDQATAERGGELMAPLYSRQLEQFPDLEEAVNALEEGMYSRPVPVPPGFGPGSHMVIKVLEKAESRPLRLDEIRDMLERNLLQAKQDEAFGEWLSEKMNEYEVVVYPDALAGIDFAELKEQGLE